MNPVNFTRLLVAAFVVPIFNQLPCSEFRLLTAVALA
jgi:hypothetical protein